MSKRVKLSDQSEEVEKNKCVHVAGCTGCTPGVSTEFPVVHKDKYILHHRNLSDVHDLSDPVLVHVNTAEAILRRGMRWHPDLPVINKLVEFNYIENKALEEQFKAKKVELQSDGKDTRELLLFHGTSQSNVHDICKGNFNLELSNRFLFGRGIYFTKCPNVGLQYGQDLILCRVLPGLEQGITKRDENSKQNLQEGFDSLEIDWTNNNDPGSNAFVIQSTKQILPYCIIRTEHSGGKLLTGQPKKSTPSNIIHHSGIGSQIHGGSGRGRIRVRGRLGSPGYPGAHFGISNGGLGRYSSM